MGVPELPSVQPTAISSSMPVYADSSAAAGLLGLSAITLIIIVASILLNIGLSFIAASMAKNKGYSYGGFLCLGIFASFLIAIIVAACLPDRTVNVQNAYATFNPQAFNVPPQPYQNTQPQYRVPDGGIMFCSKCGSRVNAGDAFCKNCGNRVQQ